MGYSPLYKPSVEVRHTRADPIAMREIKFLHFMSLLAKALDDKQVYLNRGVNVLQQG
jgi:hypothetical protein